MPIRFGVVIIPYTRAGKDVKFLVLERAMNWKGWEFPKGGIDEGENAKQAAVRELNEETGLNPIFVKKTPFKCEYFYRREGVTMKSEQEVYLAKVPSETRVIISEEHSNFDWLSKEDAVERLTWEDQKRILREIDVEKL